jgi:protein SCO1/2
MLKPLLLVGILSLSLSVGASTTLPAPAQQVGVDERLGTKVPLDLVLNDEAGHPVRLGALIDKPTVLTLNFFRCTGICTPLLNGLAEALGQTRARPGQDYQVITVSFDPTDTAEVAQMKQANYLKEVTRPVSPAAWRFLTGPADATKALCDAVGFKFQAQGTGFIHPGVTLVLSPQGTISRYLYGVTFQASDLDKATLEAAQGGARPGGNYLLQSWGVVDPQGHPVFSASIKVFGALVLLCSAVFGVILGFRKIAPVARPWDASASRSRHR